MSATHAAMGVRPPPGVDPAVWNVEEFDPPLDPGVERYVRTLRAYGVETRESCQGGAGHAYPVPTVRFLGGRAEGFRALAVAMQHDFAVDDLRRVWPINDGEPTGPYWELTFRTET